MQTYTDDCFAGSQVGQTSLQNMENNFAALKSCFSGTTQPSNAVAGMGWFDTTKKVMKQRDTANAAWLGLMHGDVSQKLWVYRNTAMDGWAIDATPTDRVLAIKGGSTYTDGGASAGSWTNTHSHGVSGLSVPGHNHQWYEGSVDTSVYTWQLNGTTAQTLIRTQGEYGYGLISIDQGANNDGTLTPPYGFVADGYTKLNAAASLSGALSNASLTAWRPAASVGTLQYLDL